MTRCTDVGVLRRAAGTLAHVATILDLPVIGSVVPAGPEGASELIGEIREQLPLMPVFMRYTASAWADQVTQAAVRGTGRPILGICGVATEVVVLHTALQAQAAGYGVRVIIDACGGFSTRTEDAAIRQMEALGVVVTSVASFATEMVSKLGSPEHGPGPIIPAIYNMAG